MADDARVAAGYQLLQRFFRHPIATRDSVALTVWLTDAEASDLPSFVTLAHGIQLDHAAVEAALAT